uniref:GRAM domain-containing protein n=1 Tax=Ciona savignyi TaxID=51511 RepID=H2YGQ8_CIOSA
MDKEDVELIFKKFSHSCEHLKGNKSGNIYLTNFRLLFVSAKSNDMLRELSMPFKNIKDFEIKQPVFGANYLQGKLVAEVGGGWEGFGLFEMTFKKGGAIEVGQKLVKLATNAPQMMYAAPQMVVHPTTPVYGYPVPGTTNAYAFPAQPQGIPQPYPSAPPVYQPGMHQAGPSQPPAYNQQQPPYLQPPNPQSKATEAAQSTLPPQYQHAPPQYDEAMKKNQ